MSLSSNKAAIIAKLGVLNLLDGNPWTNHDKRAIAIKQVALRFIHEVRYWLNLTINPDQTPCQIANKLVKRLGLEVVAISRPGRRNQKRVRRYALPDLENPLRLKLLQAVRHKLSASVSTISIRDPIPNLEIMDTGSSGTLYSRLTPDSQSWQIGDRVQSGQIFRRECVGEASQHDKHLIELCPILRRELPLATCSRTEVGT